MCIFSNMVKPSCISEPPEICVSTIFGFTGLPQSTTLISRVMRTWPVSVSTSTSAPDAADIQNGVTLVVRPVSGSGGM